MDPSDSQPSPLPLDPTASATPSATDLKTLGDSLFCQGRYEEAIQAYSVGLSLDPTHISLYQNRSLCHLKLGNFTEVQANCDAILQLEPQNIKALLNRSHALEKLGHLTEAIIDLRSALNLGADDSALLSRLADLERRVQPVLVESSQSSPSMEQIKTQGNSLFQQQKYQEALTCYNQALQLDPNNTTLYNNRGLCYLRLGQFQELKANCDTLLRIDPRNTKALFNRATAWVQEGNLDAAIQDLRLALDLTPTDPEIQTRLSKLEARRADQISTEVVIPIFSDPLPNVSSERSPLLLGSLNSTHHGDHNPNHVPICTIRWYEYSGLLLSAGILALFIYQSTQAYDKYKDNEGDPFAPYFLIELVGSIIQSLNSAHGTFAFLFRSARGLEYYGRSSTGTLVWQSIQTICLIVFSQLKNSGSVPVLTIVTAVAGWVPIITSILAVKLRFLLLTWNVPTQFTFLDDCLCESTIVDHSHCTPHDLILTTTGCCDKIYRCSQCGTEWKRT